MHARLTSFSVQPDKLAEMTQIYQNSVVPVISSQTGFKALYLLVDPTTGNGQSLTIWDSEADGLAYERSGTYQAQVDKVRAFFAGPPSLKTYELAAQSARG